MIDQSGHHQVARLTAFRAGFYRCLTSWGDALFELCDATLFSPTPVASIPALSLEPVFRRSHGSLYKALADGVIDDNALRGLLFEHRPVDWPAVFAVDASTWPRCDAETSPDRGFYYHPSRHSAGQPIVAGWSYQWLSQLDWAPDSWTAPLDVRRIPPGTDAVAATITQVRELVDRLAAINTARSTAAPVPVFVFDAGYDPIALSVGLADVRAAVVVRIRADRIFYADPPPPTPTTMGRPRRHGARFACTNPATWPQPDAAIHTTDNRYGTVDVQAWKGLHPKLAGRGRWAGTHLPPIVSGTIIRVQVEHLPKPTGRALKTLWLWWSGPGVPDLDVCWRAYLRRFDIEHTFRFAKNTLGWTTPALRTPEQADRWTSLMIGAYTQLRLARGLVDDHRLPWERPRQPDRLTPARVRRGFRQLEPIIATPAHPRKSDTPGPGRPKGTRKPPRTLYPPIKKAA